MAWNGFVSLSSRGVKNISNSGGGAVMMLAKNRLSSKLT